MAPIWSGRADGVVVDVTAVLTVSPLDVAGADVSGAESGGVDVGGIDVGGIDVDGVDVRGADVVVTVIVAAIVGGIGLAAPSPPEHAAADSAVETVSAARSFIGRDPRS